MLSTLQSLDAGMPFPAFSEYEDVFSTPLPLTYFAGMRRPGWLPHPAELLCMAEVVYPHWKDRRLRRNGQRIIPVLNVSVVKMKLCAYLIPWCAV